MIEQEDFIKVNKLEDKDDLQSEESIYETNYESKSNLSEKDE